MRSKYINLFLILLIAIIVSCSTTIEYLPMEYDLPPEPERSLLEEPKDEQDLAIIILYYETLVSDWEAWAESVNEIVGFNKEPQGDTSE